MSKVYVISELGWEYDDNNYYRSDSGGGSPIVAYRSWEKAEQACKQKNINFFKDYLSSGEIKDYYCYREDLISDEGEKIQQIFAKFFGCSVTNWYENDVELAIKPTPKEWEELYDCFSVEWFQVTEINVEN